MAEASSGGDLLTKKKVYIVPFIQPSPQAPDGFTERFDAYWNAAEKQVAALEARAGVVNKIFAEGVLGKGDDALLMLEQTNRHAWRMAKSRVDAGARIDAYEDDDLFTQVVDWGRCLQVGFISQTVANAVTSSYQDAIQRRQERLDARLESIEDGEAVLLLTGTTNVKLPEGVERFLVSPPELDALERWIRSVNEMLRKQAEEAAARGQQPGAQGQPPESPQSGSSGGSGLWTPGS